ncbi:hypothetical protein ACWT_6044 [Actinoplanes sp. SE50]|nr:hypothetical protein ACPL_6176 [Actinoplanes sp. SE50/110]ATO85459.1 hypothetical protein ACWT_6044 [Actinoplanes sp. SE50]SLM02871.1 hypothetical protein ACSP50_6156 [Actinoplanes sp. SE50/110]
MTRRSPRPALATATGVLLAAGILGTGPGPAAAGYR